MATLQEKAAFVSELSGHAAKANADSAKRAKRAEVLDAAMAEHLPDATRESMRESMDFSMKKRGRRGVVKAIDAEHGGRNAIDSADTSQLESQSKEDKLATHKALAQILKLRDSLMAQKDDDGNPLYTPEQLVKELWTPLIREGLVVENLVTDPNSEVAQMLKSVFDSYKKMLADEKQEKRAAEAKTEIDYRGAGTRLDRVKAVKGKADILRETQMADLGRKLNMTPEEMGRASAMIGSGRTLNAAAGDFLGGLLDDTGASDALGAVGDKLSGLAESKLNPLVGKIEGSAPVRAALAVRDKAAGAFDTATAPLREAEGRVASGLNTAKGAVEGQLPMSAIGKTSEAVSNFKEENADDIDDIQESGGELAGMVGDAATRTDGLERELAQSAVSAAAKIDAAVNDALVAVSPASIGLLDGKVVEAIDTDALVTEAMSPRAQAATLVRIVCEGLAKALNGAGSADVRKALAAVAPRLTKEFAAKVDGGKLTAALKAVSGTDRAALGAEAKGLTVAAGAGVGAFDSLAAAAPAAAAAAFSDAAFTAAMAAQTAALQETARDENEPMVEQLADLQQSKEDFERQLVLLDDGGTDAAKQRSIAALIEEIESDRRNLDLIAKLGSLLPAAVGAAAGAVSDVGGRAAGAVGGAAAKTAGQALGGVGGVVTAGVKAAHLLVKMTITALEMAERAKLAVKFAADVNKARAAGSPMLPAIENFYAAKRQQTVFKSAELALQTVQMAGLICSSVPEPVTMAVGNSLTALSAVGAAASDLTEKVLTEKELRDGWALTKASMTNPKNRAAGLAAIRGNATLAVHAVAWGATAGNDPIAKEILRSCGVDAQTLADGGTDGGSVVKYLETLLVDDTRFKDVAKIDDEWVPRVIELSYASWYAVVQRAKKAPQPFVYTEPSGLHALLKSVSLQPSPATIGKNLVQYQIVQIEIWQKELVALSLAFSKLPGEHADMMGVRDRYVAMADKRSLELAGLMTARAANDAAPSGDGGPAASSRPAGAGAARQPAEAATA